MRAARARVAWAAAALACLVVGEARAGEPSATDVEEARRHYARGVQLYDQGADAAALAELERAYQLAPSWKILYDIGLVELQMHDFASALRHFEQYLSEGKDGVLAARRTEVEGRIVQLRYAVATVDVVVTDGTRVTLDDVEVGTSPLAKPLVVNAGHHRVGATKDGRVPDVRAISVAGGDRLRVELTLAETPPAAPAPIAVPVVTAPLPTFVEPATPSPPPPPADRGPPLWLGWVATGALATGAVVTGLVALGASSDLTHAKADAPATGADLDALSSRAHHFALASDLMTVSALAAGGATLYFTLRAPKHADPAAAVGLDLGPGRLTLRGIF